MADSEVPVSPEQLAAILSNVTPGAVLVGGQALAFWVAHYDISPPASLAGAISDDADFLGTRADVEAIARGVGGRSVYPPVRAITALIGQVEIPVAAGEYVNVDVLHRLIGLDGDRVRDHASEVDLNGVAFQVMHPMDVLQSRVANLAILDDKQNEQGVEQTRLALQVARAFISEVAAIPEQGQRHAMKLIEQVVTLAKSGSGRRVARDFGIEFLSALPRHAVASEVFQTRRWPQIVESMEVKNFLATREEPSDS